MFGSLGPLEIIGIVLVVVLLFGAKKIPELARSMGEGIREFKKGVDQSKNDETPKQP